MNGKRESHEFALDILENLDISPQFFQKLKSLFPQLSKADSLRPIFDLKSIIDFKDGEVISHQQLDTEVWNQVCHFFHFLIIVLER